MFNFRLQSVLNYRKQLEEKVASEFADTRRRFDCEKEILKKLEKERLNSVSRLNSMEGAKLCVADISAYFLYINYIKHKEKYHEEVISRIARESEEKRLELINAIKKRKILEMVREKKLEEYRIYLVNKERKELDEMGTSGYARNMKIEKIDNCM
jgi:flagellar FliJ protein